MTPSDLAHVNKAAAFFGWSSAGCEWLKIAATSSEVPPRIHAIARAALQRAASDGSTWAGLTLEALAEADAVPERVER